MNLVDLLLEWLQKILGANVRVFAKNAVIVTVGYGITFIRGLVTGYLVARLFPREMYGEYRFIMTVFGTVGVLSVPGIANALYRAVARGEKGVIFPVAKYQFIIALLGSVVLLGLIPFLPENRASLWPAFVLAALVFPFWQTSTTIFPGITIGKERFDLSLKTNVYWSAAAIVATLFILFVHPSPILLFLAVILLPTIAYLAFSLSFFDGSASRSTVHPIIKYGFQLTLIALPMSIAWYLDDLLVSMWLGLNSLAVFSVATLIPEQLKSWSKELIPVSYAAQARGEDSMKRRKHLAMLVGRLTLLFSGGILLYVLLAPVAFRILFPNYMDAILLTQIAAVSLFSIPSTLFVQYMEAHSMLWAMRWTLWISAALFCIALLVLIPLFHLIGAVFALVILRSSYALCSFFFFLSQPIAPSLVPLKEDPLAPHIADIG